MLIYENSMYNTIRQRIRMMLKKGAKIILFDHSDRIENNSYN